MKCKPNYILSDAQQQALPSEKLISECPLHPVSITGFSNESAAIIVNVQCGTSREHSTEIASECLGLVLAFQKVQKQIQQAKHAFIHS